MKTRKNILQNIALLTLILAGFISCEKDFASIDSDVVNSDNATNFSTDILKFPVRTYNKKITPLRLGSSAHSSQFPYSLPPL